MYISKIRVRNYKSFLDSGEVIVDKNLFALIGQNNTGKSAILDAIQCMFPSAKKSITNSDFHRGSKDEIKIEIWFSDVTDEYIERNIFSDKISTQQKKVKNLKDEIKEKSSTAIEKRLEKEIGKIEEVRKENLKGAIEKYCIVNNSMYIGLVAKKGERISQKFYIEDDKEIKEVDLKKILPPIKIIPAIRDPKNESTAGTNSYLKELIQMLDDQVQTNIQIQGKSISYNDLNKVIGEETKLRCKALGESITGFYNEAIGTTDYKVIIDSDVNISKGTTYNTRIKDVNTGIESDILNCGTGYQSMIILSILETYVKVSNNTQKYILLIEEPEVYLHPSLQRKMIDTLVTISESSQVIFTSHSPITVSKLEKKQVKLVRKECGGSVIEDVVPRIVIDELGIKSDDIISNKAIIFVEGKDDKKIFEIILEKIESGLSERINVIDAGNCNNLKFYANAQLLINNMFSIPTLIVRDADTKRRDKRRESLIREISNCRNKITDDLKEKIQDSVRITDEYSIEGYFVDHNLLGNFMTSDSETLKLAVKCYECQYKYYSEEVYEGRIEEKVLSSWYQPKYFLERFTDKFKASEVDKIYKHNERYEQQWRKYPGCTSCLESDIEEFFTARNKINSLSKDLKANHRDIMIESIRTTEIDVLKETKLKDIIIMLEGFTSNI